MHRHHSIFLSEQEIRENQRNTAYREQIVNEVIEKIRVRHFGSAVHVRYPLLQYFEISIMPYHVITTVFNDIYITLNIDFVPEDKTLIDILNRDISILYEQYEKRSTENFDLYYDIHH